MYARILFLLYKMQRSLSLFLSLLHSPLSLYLSPSLSALPFSSFSFSPLFSLFLSHSSLLFHIVEFEEFTGQPY